MIQDRLIKLGGAEKVLDQFLIMFPKAPVYTTIYNSRATKNKYANRKIKTSFLQKIPFATKLERYLLPLFPKAVESFDFSGYDLVISNTYSFGKGVITKKPTIHISYCHTPTRFLWHEIDKGMEKAGIVKKIFEAFLPSLRKWDLKASKRPDYIVANSENISKRMEKYYHRKADAIIYPPCDGNPKSKISREAGSRSAKQNPKSRENFYLVLSRLEIHKKVDLAVETFNQNGKKLIIIGGGSEEKKLKKMAKGNIVFLGEISDNGKREYLKKARALIFPQVEDFGIVPLEAQAYGMPVIAYGLGGAVETVKNNQTGLFFKEQTAGSLNNAIKRFEKKSWNQKEIKKWAEKFNQKRFKKEWFNLIEKFIN